MMPPTVSLNTFIYRHVYNALFPEQGRNQEESSSVAALHFFQLTLCRENQFSSCFASLFSALFPDLCFPWFRFSCLSSSSNPSSSPKRSQFLIRFTNYHTTVAFVLVLNAVQLPHSPVLIRFPLTCTIKIEQPINRSLVMLSDSGLEERNLHADTQEKPAL